MVDSVKSAISRIETPRAQKANANATAKQQAAGSSGAAEQDSVQLKSSEIAATAKEMASVAPVNMDNVNKIKAAIKEGKYPIDIDKISDALMDAYRELKS